jgi:V/A-type H+-transporting ATPase subunit A
MSGRLEEIPGEEAFPAYLDSAIKNLYERAGLYRFSDGSEGALTMIGTVSPAGGNFEEPVTQSTLATVKTFLGLSYNRAYKRFFPAIEPLISWSKYLQQMEKYYSENRGEDWVQKVTDCITLLKEGEGINQMMQVSGEEGITIDDYIKFQRSLFLDMVYLQQDAFDKVDASSKSDRQIITFNFVVTIINNNYKFNDKRDVREFFLKLTDLFKNFNYSVMDSEQYKDFKVQIDELIKSKL